MERARGLTQQLLTFTKADQPVTAPVALQELVQAAARFALAGSSVSCTFDLPGDLWPWQADRRQIDQVVDNILINARQAMPDGGDGRDLGAERRDRPGDAWGLTPGRYVTLIVRDDGVGIPQDMQAKVFDPFFTTKPTGTGLGLATSYSIAKKHGGHIALESDPGAGTTFRVCLPAAAESAVVEGARPPRRRRGEGRVLVMDDEPHVRDIARECLEELGYEVATAANGVEAVAAFERAAKERPALRGRDPRPHDPGAQRRRRGPRAAARARLAGQGDRLERLLERSRDGEPAALRLLRDPGQALPARRAERGRARGVGLGPEP